MTEDIQKAISDDKLDDLSEKELRKIAKDYGQMILLRAKLNALYEKSEKINVSHIQQALDSINPEKKHPWQSELTVIVGSALFGGFIPGFITEINGNTVRLIVYVVMGFIGMLLVFIGITRR